MALRGLPMRACLHFAFVLTPQTGFSHSHPMKTITAFVVRTIGFCIRYPWWVVAAAIVEAVEQLDLAYPKVSAEQKKELAAAREELARES